VPIRVSAVNSDLLVRKVNGDDRLLNRRCRQKTNSPSRIAKNKIGILNSIVIFAPAERSSDGGGVGIR
jgi:hypothetical protein